VKSLLKFKNTRLPSRRRISPNLISRLQKEAQSLPIEKVVSGAIRISKRDKDSSDKGRLNVIKDL